MLFNLLYGVCIYKDAVENWFVESSMYDVFTERKLRVKHNGSGGREIEYGILKKPLTEKW